MKSKALSIVAILACGAVILIGCGGGGGGGTTTTGTTGASATSTGSTGTTGTTGTTTSSTTGTTTSSTTGTTGTTTSTTTGTTTSSTTGTTGSGANPFGGRWDGTFTQASPANNGTITLAIAGNGGVSGDTFDSNLNEEGIVSGAITNGGVMALKVKYASVTQTWSGTASIDSGTGHMTGTIHVTSGGTTTTMTFDLAPF